MHREAHHREAILMAKRPIKGNKKGPIEDGKISYCTAREENMKRRSLPMIAAIIASAMLIAGCGGNAGTDAGDISESVQEITQAVQESASNADEPEEEAEVEEEVDTEDEEPMPLPVFVLDYASESKELDGNIVVEHEIEQISLENADGTYEELGRKLAIVNDNIKKSELEAMESDFDSVTDHDESIVRELLDDGFYPLRSSWRIYVRRADRICSIATEYRIAGDEGDYVEMRGHSYLADTGKELKLSDIVSDQLAFDDLLAEKLSLTVTDKMRRYTGENDLELIDCRDSMHECMDSDRSGWVLDPQGITFWFQNVNAVLQNTTVTILFSEDKDGVIFDKEYTESAPDEWIMQIPGNYSETQFDCDDNGIIDTISWIVPDIAGYEGETYPSGIDVNFNRMNYISSELIESYDGMFYGTIAMLVHKNGQTCMLAYYCEEADPNFVSLALEGDTVSPAGAEHVYIGRSADGEYVPVDPSSIKVYSDHGGDEITEYPEEFLSVEGDGTMSLR